MGLDTNPGTCPECSATLTTRNWRGHMKRHGWVYDHLRNPDTLFALALYKKINGVDGYYGPDIPATEEPS
jgi:hypothetical protein